GREVPPVALGRASQRYPPFCRDERRRRTLSGSLRASTAGSGLGFGSGEGSRHRVLVAERLLDDLARACTRPVAANLQLLGDLLCHQPSGATKGGEFFEREVAGAVNQLDDGTDPFAPIGVG